MTLPAKLGGTSSQPPRRRHAPSRPPKTGRKRQREDAFEAKQRNCLMCSAPFPSAWPGERVCKRCKESAAWRSG